MKTIDIKAAGDATSRKSWRIAFICAFAITIVIFLSSYSNAPASLSKLTITSNAQSIQIHKRHSSNQQQTQDYIKIEEKSDIEVLEEQSQHHKPKTSQKQSITTTTTTTTDPAVALVDQEYEDVEEIDTSAVKEFLPPLDDNDGDYYYNELYAAPPLPYPPPPPPPPSSKYMEDKYHVVVTTDNTIYAQWMIQVAYYHYKRLKAADPDGPMGGFTRVLHSNTTDCLMDIIPTIRVDEVDPSVFRHMGYYYAPLNRPWAYAQWVRDHMHKIPERYILMAEPDHLFLSQPPLLATPERAAAYKFFYMEPQAFPELFVNSRRFNPTNTSLESFLPIGNSPSIMTREDLASIALPWYRYTKKMMRFEDSRSAFGWVVEMYGFVAAAATRPQGPLKVDLIENFMCQPPVEVLHLDSQGKPIEYMIHFTYKVFEGPNGVCVPEESLKVEAGGNATTWSFDKRSYLDRYPPRNIPLPPANCEVGVRTAIEMINEAAAAIPNWGEGR